MLSQQEVREYILRECGAGWIALADEAFAHLPAGVQITQVYQKWGALCFEFTPEHAEFAGFLQRLKQKSQAVCEICGAPGDEKILDSWLRTLCDGHQHSYPPASGKEEISS